MSASIEAISRFLAGGSYVPDIPRLPLPFPIPIPSGGGSPSPVTEEVIDELLRMSGKQLYPGWQIGDPLPPSAYETLPPEGYAPPVPEPVLIDQSGQEIPLPDAAPSADSTTAASTAGTSERAARREQRRAERAARREARRAARQGQPRPILGDILKQIFRGSAQAPAPTPGQLRKQAERAQPMSLLGNVTQFLQRAGQAQQIYNTVRNAAGTAIPMSIAPVARAGARSTLAALPGAGTIPMRSGSSPQYRRYMSTGRRRRTNPTNVRALRRALSRIEGFIKIEKRVDKILRRVAPKARQAQKVGFIKRRR